MSEEQVKSQDELSSNKKPKKAKNDEVAKLQAQVDNLTMCLSDLATRTGNQALMKKYDIKPYEYNAAELKRRA